MKCVECGSEDVEEHPEAGTIACRTCGEVRKMDGSLAYGGPCEKT